MKRILSVLLVALMLVGMLPMHAIHAHAATETELAILGTSGTLASDSSSISWTNGDITVTNIKGSTAIRTSDSAHYRAYQNSTFTIESASGNTITQIVVTCTSSSYADVLTNSIGDEAKASSSTVTITPSSESSTYTSAKLTAQVRLSKMVVTTEAAGTGCAHTNTTENSDGYAATCTENGLTNSVSCADCGETVTEQAVIEAPGHSFENGVCSVCGQKLAVVSFSVPSQVASVESITADESGVVTLPAAADYTGKYPYTFAGWAESAVADTETAPSIYTAGSEYETAADVTLYAVYTYTVAGTGGSTEYVLTDASGINPGDTVVIATTNDNINYYAMSNGNGTSKAPTATKVTVSDGKLEDSNDLTSLKWDIGGSAGEYIFYPADQTATWLYCTSTNNGVRVGTNGANTFKIDSSSGYLVHNGTSRYIGVYNSSDWRCYTSVNSNITGQTLCFFVKTSGGAEYYTSTLEDADSTCTHEKTTSATVNATCTDAGSVTVTCDDCGATVSTTVIPATGHTEVTDAAVEPTCVDTGLTAGSHCSACNAVITAQETVPATGEHTYVDGTCSVCGEKEPSTGATKWQLVESADELQVGDRIVIVAANEDVALSTTQNNNNRAEIAITKNASDKTVGVIDGVQIITLESGTTDGTFAFYVEAEDGSTGYLYAASSGSNYLKTETYLSDNSSWVITISGGVATVKAQGTNTRNWLRYNTNNNIFSCYSSGQQDIAIYKETVSCAHATTTDVAEVPATCTSVGYTAGVKCEECGDYISGHEVIPMQDHSYDAGKVTTDPGCTTAGVKTYTCAVCGGTKEEPVAATGHLNTTTTTVPATCTVAGSITVTCDDCDAVISTETLPASHSWSDWAQTKAPTCTEAGEKSRTCSICGETEIQSVDALGHSWGDWAQTKAPTCTEAGEESRTCSTCGDIETQPIAASGHSYNANGVCTVCGSEVGYFKLVTDYTEILSGGQYIIAALTGTDDSGNPIFTAMDTAADNQLKAKSVTVSGSGTEMKVIYAEDVPIWNIEYYTGGTNCFTIYNKITGTYLAGGASTSLSTSTDAWAWTFADATNEGEEADGDTGYGVLPVTQEDGSVAFVVVSNTVSADRAITYRNSAFTNYSVRTAGYNREMYFFKMVEAGATEYTVTFKENGTETITQTVPVKENVIEMPESTGAAMPSGYTNFIGWVTLPHAESLIAPTTIYKAGDAVPITEDTVFYALYTREDADAEGQSMSYHRVTDNSQLQIGQKYIIVGLATDGSYWAMSKDQLSDDRGASAVTPDENGVITFVPEDNLAVFELEQGYDIGSFAFLDLNMNMLLYCSSSDSNASLKSQAALNSAASFVIDVVQDETTGAYSTMMANVSVVRKYLMFNTVRTENRLFSCYELHADSDTEGNLEQNTFLYVGVTNDVAATYYATGLCDHQWDDGVTTLPSCTNAGYTVYTCTVCGEVKIENVAAHGHDLGEATVIEPTCTQAGSSTSVCQREDCLAEWVETIPALGHDIVSKAAYNDKNVPCVTHQCSRCDEGQVIEMKYTSASVTLANTLIVNFWSPANMSGTDQYAGFENISATFTYGNRVGDYAITVDISEAELRTDALVFPCRYITPSQIGDTITATLTGTYNGESFTYTMEYGVASYCYNILNDENYANDSELRTLLVDMLYYCDAARTYTTYKADESVTAKLTEEQKAERTTTDPELSSVLNGKYAVVDSPKASWKSASLIMYHATRMRFRFETTADISTLTVKATVASGEKEAYIQEENGQYFVYVDGLNGFEMRETVYVTLYEGDTAVSNTITYSIETYAYNKQNDADADLVALLKAMLRYGDSAIAYRN